MKTFMQKVKVLILKAFHYFTANKKVVITIVTICNSVLRDFFLFFLVFVIIFYKARKSTFVLISLFVAQSKRSIFFFLRPVSLLLYETAK